MRRRLLRFNSKQRGHMECPPTEDKVLPHNVRTNQKAPPPVKGAGAKAPEGLLGLEFLLSRREGKPLPYGIWSLSVRGRPSVAPT